jgi:hypothetical protein
MAGDIDFLMLVIHFHTRTLVWCMV